MEARAIEAAKVVLAAMVCWRFTPRLHVTQGKYGQADPLEVDWCEASGQPLHLDWRLPVELLPPSPRASRAPGRRPSASLPPGRPGRAQVLLLGLSLLVRPPVRAPTCRKEKATGLLKARRDSAAGVKRRPSRPMAYLAAGPT
jgi:hypothetical protein